MAPNPTETGPGLLETGKAINACYEEIRSYISHALQTVDKPGNKSLLGVPENTTATSVSLIIENGGKYVHPVIDVLAPDPDKTLINRFTAGKQGFADIFQSTVADDKSLVVYWGESVKSYRRVALSGTRLTMDEGHLVVADDPNNRAGIDVCVDIIDIPRLIRQETDRRKLEILHALIRGLAQASGTATAETPTPGS